MKVEVKKEFSMSVVEPVFRVYIDGSLSQSFFKEDEAMDHVKKIESTYFPEPETIYVKELP